ncbi:MAG: hypothetical protein II733_00850, partial [Succinivibrio sp.]|nr:hypothetical protein [Succinivibrio sp.]
LLQNNTSVYKDLYGRAAKLQNWDMDIDDLIDEAYARFEEACHNPDAMREYEDALGDLAENVMKTMMQSEDIRTIDLEDMKLVIQQTKAIKQMADTSETYRIPIKLGDEVADMNLRIVRGDKETGLIRMAVYLQDLGTVQTTFRYESGTVSANVECDTASLRDKLSEQIATIQTQMKEQTGFDFNFSFTRESGLNVSDIYNWQTGNFTEENDTDNEVQTEALYGIARGYLRLLGQLF